MLKQSKTFMYFWEAEGPKSRHCSRENWECETI
jgi:hypothetical protein